jgi:hypothetical protein
MLLVRRRLDEDEVHFPAEEPTPEFLLRRRVVHHECSYLPGRMATAPKDEARILGEVVYLEDAVLQPEPLQWGSPRCELGNDGGSFFSSTHEVAMSQLISQYPEVLARRGGDEPQDRFPSMGFLKPSRGSVVDELPQFGEC